VSRIRLTAALVTAAMQGRLVAGGGETAFENVSIDSRTIGADGLFVAIRGERFDGADFAAAAIEKGAAGVVVPTVAYVTLPGHGAASLATFRGWLAQHERTVLIVLAIPIGGLFLRDGLMLLMT